MPKLDFQFSDTASFQTNLIAFEEHVTAIDEVLGSRFVAALTGLAEVRVEREALLDELMAALAAQAGITLEAVDNGTTEQRDGDDASSAAAASEAQPETTEAGHTQTPRRWFLIKIEIEGFRGINNEGAPLALKFKADAVNSIAAPNAVGKSSIYDALSYALTGGIPKLDRLAAAERPADYYLNRFHSGDIGTIVLTVLPDDGGEEVAITIKRPAAGTRAVTATNGVDGEALLAELNREFVLLDGTTFQSFIDDRALDRGRAFSGLLGLSRYSDVRQALQAVAHTRAFNGHFDVAANATAKSAADRRIAAANAAITRDYDSLVKEPLRPDLGVAEAQARCHAALDGTPVLRKHCADRPFMQLDIDDCIETLREEEGGPNRERYGEVLRQLDEWK
jgi:hypothetical protein